MPGPQPPPPPVIHAALQYILAWENLVHALDVHQVEIPENISDTLLQAAEWVKSLGGTGPGREQDHT
jgi:hypothetical protein